MVNVLMVVPNRQDATSLYRSMGPFSDMRRQQEFNMIFADAIDWSIVNMVDMVFMQRPFTDAHRQLAELCNLWETPLWVDYDDLLFDIPTDNPAHGTYMKKNVREDIVNICKRATCITVSTTQLKRCLQLPQHCLNDRVFVVENAIIDRFLKKQQKPGDKPLICWRGSNTHQKDLGAYGGEIIDLALEHPEATWNFVGYNPWFITDSMKPEQAIVAPPMPIGEYFDYMVKINPMIQIVPLDQSMFNACKSNIAWIEGTLAGAVTIAPDWEEWRKPGVITYSDPASFKKAVKVALSMPEKLKEFHAMSVEHINKELRLSVINKKRLKIMNALGVIASGRPAGEVAQHVGYDWPAGGARLTDRDKDQGNEL